MKNNRKKLAYLEKKKTKLPTTSRCHCWAKTCTQSFPWLQVQSCCCWTFQQSFLTTTTQCFDNLAFLPGRLQFASSATVCPNKVLLNIGERIMATGDVLMCCSQNLTQDEQSREYSSSLFLGIKLAGSSKKISLPFPSVCCSACLFFFIWNL